MSDKIDWKAVQEIDDEWIYKNIFEKYAKRIEEDIRFKTSQCENEGCPNPERRYLKIKSNQKYCSNYCRLAAWRKSKKVNKDE